ncbi:MAG: hypothetical protein GY796_29685, partial [Chloroflexi bacterium]|nr:hypothetical protein [Chloroflexota bacterium]
RSRRSVVSEVVFGRGHRALDGVPFGGGEALGRYAGLDELALPGRGGWGKLPRGCGQPRGEEKHADQKNETREGDGAGVKSDCKGHS